MEKWADSLDKEDWDTSFNKAIPAKLILYPGKPQVLTCRWSAALHCYRALEYHILFDNRD